MKRYLKPPLPHCTTATCEPPATHRLTRVVLHTSTPSWSCGHVQAIVPGITGDGDDVALALDVSVMDDVSLALDVDDSVDVPLVELLTLALGSGVPVTHQTHPSRCVNSNQSCKLTPPHTLHHCHL